MTTEVRRIRPDEQAELDLRVGRGFLDAAVADHPDPDPDPDRTFAFFLDDEMAGGCSSYSFQLTVPGGATVPVGGLTGVAVEATSRRRGGLRGLIAAHLEDCRERGEAASVLMASQAGIYGRFGYGVATESVGWAVRTSNAHYSEPIDSPGSFRFVRQEDAAELLATIYTRALSDRPGALDRPGAWFDGVLHRTRSWMGGGDLFVVIHRDHHGVDDGYVLYSFPDQDPGDNEPVVLSILELVAGDPAVEAALWRFCLDVDLVTEVRYLWGPVDPAVGPRLVDSRLLRTTRRQDYLWLRPLDVAAVLGERAYRVDGALTLRIEDPDDPQVDGTWSLDIIDGVATVARTDAEPEVTMSAASLGAACLGGGSVDRMARSGSVEGTPASVANADLLLGTARPPWCITKF